MPGSEKLTIVLTEACGRFAVKCKALIVVQGETSGGEIILGLDGGDWSGAGQ